MISIRAAKAKLLSAIHRRLRANGRSLEITKSGWFLIFLTLLVGAVAINSGANLLHSGIRCIDRCDCDQRRGVRANALARASHANNAKLLLRSSEHTCAPEA